MRSQQRTIQLTVVLGLLASGCEFFQGEDDTDFGDESESESGTDDGDEPPPSQGFRVFPRFMLQDLSAIVTIELDWITPLPCELDGAPEGGYLCDASSLPAGGVATVMVEKDGFASAVRHPQLVDGQITTLEVHLAVEGGPTGVWSGCHLVGEFSSCEELCASTQSSCMVTSCATANAEWPIATYETFTDAECLTSFASEAATCGESLPLSGSSVALRCCCAS
ncbi:MAG TPA: hypothetical protein VM869_11735 [Enhygromyxa sp.]|nr:hypothetical protein [Enhygromyxa sp.]